MSEELKDVAVMKESKYFWESKPFRRLMRRKSAVFGLVIISFFTLIAIMAPFLTPYSPTEINLEKINNPPSKENLFGCDEMGRDIMTRIFYGARTSLKLGMIAVIIGGVLGTSLGLVSAYYGGYVDLIIQRLIDVLLAFPGIVLAILLVSIFGAGIGNAMIAVGFASIPQYVRLVRSSVFTIKEQEYVKAAKALGASDFRIMFLHILPNCLGPIIVQSTLRIATAILWAAGLGFLGLTGSPVNPEWGTMLSKGRDFLYIAPHVVIVPGISIVLVVLGFNLFGDGLRDALDPRADL